MNIFRNIALISIVLGFVSCSGTSEDPLVGDWDRRSTFPSSRRAFAATFVIDNVGYVVGGIGEHNPPRREIFAFHHTDGSGLSDGRRMGNWQELGVTDNEMLARQQAVGFSLKDATGKGYGFVGSGWVWTTDVNGRDDYHTSHDFWRYEPVNDPSNPDLHGIWEEVTPLPGPPRRGAFAFTLTVDGKEYGYVGGGFTDRLQVFRDFRNAGRDVRGEYLNDVWRFDPDGWTTFPGKDEDGNDVNVTLRGVWERVEANFQKRLGAVAFVIDNKAYICNGENPALINDFWVYDPSLAERDRWKILRTMNRVNQDESYDDDYAPLGRTQGVSFVVTVPEERANRATGHIVGGRQSTASTCWEYNEDDDLWTQRTRFVNNGFPQNRVGMVSFSFPPTSEFNYWRAFVGMGNSGTQFFDDMWEFIPRVEDNVYRDMQ